jgi:hypothetical protein
MTQPASYQVPAHPSGLDMRTQLNNIVLAILGDNTGPTPPTETYPGMMWGDTSALRLKRRNNVNDAWIDIGPLDNFLGDITGQINNATANKVSKSGDVMTGRLTAPDFVSYGNLYVNNGAAYLNTDGNIYGPAFGNDWLTTWVSNNFAGKWGYGNIVINDGGLYVYRSSDGNGYGASLTPGNFELWGYDFGCYIDFKQVQSQDFVWRLQMAQNGSTMVLSQSGGQWFTFEGNGNIYCGGRGYVWDAINGKAPNGAQVQYNSGIIESAQFAAGTGATIDMGNPWVVEGMRLNQGPTWQWLRAIWQRNA